MQTITINRIGQHLILTPQNGARIKTKTNEATVDYLNRHKNLYHVTEGLELLPEFWRNQLPVYHIQDINENHVAQLLINQNNQ